MDSIFSHLQIGNRNPERDSYPGGHTSLLEQSIPNATLQANNKKIVQNNLFNFIVLILTL